MLLTEAVGCMLAGGREVKMEILAYRRPDWVAGASNNPIQPGDYDHYSRVDAFKLQELGTHGNLGRNTLTTLGSKNVDFSLFKNFPLGWRETKGWRETNIEFRAELFNLFNFTNFGNPNNTFASWTPAQPQISTTFGRIIATGPEH